MIKSQNNIFFYREYFGYLYMLIKLVNIDKIVKEWRYTRLSYF